MHLFSTGPLKVECHVFLLFPYFRLRRSAIIKKKKNKNNTSSTISVRIVNETMAVKIFFRQLIISNSI